MLPKQNRPKTDIRDLVSSADKLSYIRVTLYFFSYPGMNFISILIGFQIILKIFFLYFEKIILISFHYLTLKVPIKIKRFLLLFRCDHSTCEILSVIYGGICGEMVIIIEKEHSDLGSNFG